MKVNFFIVGAPKAGTTSLYSYLNQHHSISMSLVKEPNYFSHKEILAQKLYYKTKLITDLKKYHSLFDFKNSSCLLLKYHNDIQKSLLLVPYHCPVV